MTIASAFDWLCDCFGCFQMTVEKPIPKQLLRPITTGANSAMNQSEFLVITCNSLKEQEKSRVQGAIDFGFASHWLKNSREYFKLSIAIAITYYFRQTSFENCTTPQGISAMAMCFVLFSRCCVCCNTERKGVCSQTISVIERKAIIITLSGIVAHFTA